MVTGIPFEGVVDAATGARATWRALLAEASALLDRWGLRTDPVPDVVAVCPRSGLEGIADLLAASLHEGVAAIVPTEYLVPPLGQVQSPHEPASTVVVRQGIARKAPREPQFRRGMVTGSGKHLLVASGGSSGSHRVGEIPIGQLSPPSTAYRMAGLNVSSCMYVGGSWSHSAFAWALFTALETESTLVVTSQFRPEYVASAMDDLGVVWAQLPPTEFHALAPRLRERRWRPRTLRFVVTTGGRTRPDAREAWYSALTAKNVYDMFATTEGIGALLANGEEQLERPGTSGRPVWARAQVRSESGEIVLSPKEGALYLKSLTRVGGASPKYRSAGDLARIDEDGYIYLVGRTDDEIVIEGLNVNLTALAQSVETISGVAEAVVVDTANGMSETPVLGVLAIGANLNVELLRRTALRKIAREFGPLAAPRRWKVATELPRTSNGKLDRRRVVQILAEVNKRNEDERRDE